MAVKICFAVCVCSVCSCLRSVDGKFALNFGVAKYKLTGASFVFLLLYIIFRVYEVSMRLRLENEDFTRLPAHPICRVSA